MRALVESRFEPVKPPATSVGGARIAALGLSMAFAFAACGEILASHKDDVVVFRNGDRLTGEIKRVQRGQLAFKTDTTDKIWIEWDDVAELTSRQHLEVENSRGVRYYGALRPGSEAGRVRVEGFDTSIELPLAEIVGMTPIEDRFLTRLDGSFSLGYSYNQSSDLKTAYVSTSIDYRTKTFLYGLDIDSIRTQQESGTTSRDDLSILFQRFLSNHWFTNWSPQAQRNEELGIDLRLLLPVAVGRDLVRTNRTIFSLASGVAFNEEWLAGVDESRQTLEALGKMRWDIFRDDFPRTDIATDLTVYRGLTQEGGARGEMEISVRYEILKDFFFELDVQESYDSDPDSDGAERNDLVLSTSLAWTF